MPIHERPNQGVPRQHRQSVMLQHVLANAGRSGANAEAARAALAALRLKCCDSTSRCSTCRVACVRKRQARSARPRRTSAAYRRTARPSTRGRSKRDDGPPPSNKVYSNAFDSIDFETNDPRVVARRNRSTASTAISRAHRNGTRARSARRTRRRSLKDRATSALSDLRRPSATRLHRTVERRSRYATPSLRVFALCMDLDVSAHDMRIVRRDRKPICYDFSEIGTTRSRAFREHRRGADPDAAPNQTSLPPEAALAARAHRRMQVVLELSRCRRLERDRPPCRSSTRWQQFPYYVYAGERGLSKIVPTDGVL